MRTPRGVQSEAGISLVEVLVALLLTGVVAATAFATITSVASAERFNDEYTKVGDDGRLSIEGVRRELREGRRVFGSSTPQHLYWWADRNQDGLQQADEQIHYCVAEMSSNTCITTSQAGKFRLVRWSDAQSVDDARTVAATLTHSDVFSNFLSPVDATRVVKLTLQLDVREGGDGPEEIEMQASVRLRNVS